MGREKRSKFANDARTTADLASSLAQMAANVKSVFNAKGDSINDDTLVLTNALKSNYTTIFLPDGTFKITDTMLINSGSVKKVIGSKNTVLSIQLSAGKTLLDLSVNVAFENIIFDFNNSNVKYGFFYRENLGEISLKNCQFKNVKDMDSTYGSIIIYINPQGNTFDIDKLTFDSIFKLGNGTITDSNGSLNCLYIGGLGTYTQGSISKISFKEIHNINASSQVIYEDTSGIYIITPTGDSDNKISISDVYGYNFGKRLLKIHASNVTVSNVLGNSQEGDSLGVIGFLSGDGMGDKTGCSASHVRAYGKMEAAFSASAFGVKWKDVISYTTPGNKTGMSNASDGLLINGDDTQVDGYESGSERLITIGSPDKIIKNTELKNLKFNITSLVTFGINNVVGTLGFDGLTIDNIYTIHDSTSLGVSTVGFENYLNGTTVKGRNVVVNNVRIVSLGPIDSYGLNFVYCENISLDNYRYINTSANTHFRLAIFDNCKNVNVDSVVIEGANQIGVLLNQCTGRNTVNRVQNTGATTAAVYNNNSSDVIVQNCDPAKVMGVTTATPQNAKWTVGTTSTRPTTGLVAGLSQHFDTDLGKPIWWNGSVWKDSAGTTV
jgi:hypothetical protein